MRRMDDLREKVLEYIDKHGSPKIWFARKLGISHTHFNRFLSGERDLSKRCEELLEQIIVQK